MERVYRIVSAILKTNIIYALWIKIACSKLHYLNLGACLWCCRGLSIDEGGVISSMHRRNAAVLVLVCLELPLVLWNNLVFLV